MTCLWNKFKNQNKIATLLGVNRSSVNRRCNVEGENFYAKEGLRAAFGQIEI